MFKGEVEERKISKTLANCRYRRKDENFEEKHRLLLMNVYFLQKIIINTLFFQNIFYAACRPTLFVMSFAFF